MTNCVSYSESAMAPRKSPPDAVTCLRISESQWYNYIYCSCRDETDVEDIVMGTLAVVACPQYGGTM